MTTCFLAPDPIQSTQFIPGGNTPANGGQLFFYAAGSSTKQTVYKDNAAAVAWSNPIVLDSGGNLPSGGEVWFPTGQTFKVVFAPSNDTDPPASPYWTKDTLSGVNDVSATVSEWSSGPAPTFISGTSFSVSGDQRTTFTVGRRVKTTNTGGTVYSTITTSQFGAGITTITVANDASNLDVGLSAVFYGLLDPANPSIDFYHVLRDGGTIASAGNGTTDIWGVKGSAVHISGTNAIFSFSTASYAGARRTVIADGAFPITTSSVLSSPLGNVTTTAGDRFEVLASTATASVILWYQQASLSSNTVFAGPSTGVGPPSFRKLVAAEAGYTMLDIKTVGAATSVINMTSAINSAFTNYQIIGTNVLPTTTNAALLLVMGTTDGTTVTFDTGGGSYAVAALVLNAAGVSQNNNSPGAANIALNGTQGINSTQSFGGMNFTMYLRNPAGQAMSKSVDWIGDYASVTSRALVTGAGFGVSGGLTASSVAAIQFSMNSGTISTGTFALYGIRNT